jgi:hypothetical protein
MISGISAAIAILQLLKIQGQKKMEENGDSLICPIFLLRSCRMPGDAKTSALRVTRNSISL